MVQSPVVEQLDRGFKILHVDFIQRFDVKGLFQLKGGCQGFQYLDLLAVFTGLDE